MEGGTPPLGWRLASIAIAQQRLPGCSEISRSAEYSHRGCARRLQRICIRSRDPLPRPARALRDSRLPAAAGHPNAARGLRDRAARLRYGRRSPPQCRPFAQRRDRLVTQVVPWPDTMKEIRHPRAPARGVSRRGRGVEAHGSSSRGSRITGTWSPPTTRHPQVPHRRQSRWKCHRFVRGDGLTMSASDWRRRRAACAVEHRLKASRSAWFWKLIAR